MAGEMESSEQTPQPPVVDPPTEETIRHEVDTKTEEAISEPIATKLILPPNPPTKRIGKLQFTDLPVDIKTLIVGHLIRPTDMKNLCLVSKQMHEITVRHLYREVTLEVGSATDTKLTAFIHPRNIGLRHIRKLDLYLAEVMDKCNQLQQAHLAIGMILEFLPENILEKFSWHPWLAFSGDNLLLLYRKQKRMNWLEGISLDREVLAEVEKQADEAVFSSVRKLGLYPDTREVLDFCAMLIRKTTNIEKITLHASFDEVTDHPPIPNRELNDSSTEPGLITRTLFGHMQPFENCKPMSLKDLTMQKINLRYAADTYCRVIDFDTLKALRLFGCSGADSLFANLSKSSKLPALLDTLEFKHDDNQENDALNALDGFLCLITGLKILTVDLCYAKSLPASAGITRHSKTLTELNIHASRGDGVEEEELVYDFVDYEKILKACSKIEQLSIAFPSTSIVRTNSDQFDQFENALSHLPSLITLNITTWPSNTPSSTRLPRKMYESLLQIFAQNIFEQSLKNTATSTLPATSPATSPSTSPATSPSTPPPYTSKLGLVAFGASDKVYDREDSKNQIIFAKGKQIDALGKEGPLAVPIGWCLRKFVEPRSEVLEFCLARSVRPPTREPVHSEDSD